LSFPRKRESRKYFFFKQIKEKKNGFPIELGMTKKKKKKRSKHWIPNQVGDDSEYVFGDDSGVVFEDDKLLDPR